MKRDKALFLIFIITLGLGFFLFFQNNLLEFYYELSLKLPGIEKEVTDFLEKEVEKYVSTPPPLRNQKEDSQSFLTQSGVVEWTNIQRQKYGLPPLKENNQLSITAELKIQDMFKNQYFAHNSPLGIGIGDLVRDIGYEFIAIGENLALGNYENDETLVQAWMDSLGHRENILNAKYQEIGVSVVKGTFEGKPTWLAVQHFGLPLSFCVQPDRVLEEKIKVNQAQINELQAALEALETKIRNTRPRRSSQYNQLIDQYNNLVSQYNALVGATEILIDKFNVQVNIFNQCAAGA
ncbi:CAP domain-containing protein [Patescibacteria group bacterium]